jgi:hypothetical protein
MGYNRAAVESLMERAGSLARASSPFAGRRLSARRDVVDAEA